MFARLQQERLTRVDERPHEVAAAAFYEAARDAFLEGMKPRPATS
jgi:hypothetical protein